MRPATGRKNDGLRFRGSNEAVAAPMRAEPLPNVVHESLDVPSRAAGALHARKTAASSIAAAIVERRTERSYCGPSLRSL
jgi:hypothetical protein